MHISPRVNLQSQIVLPVGDAQAVSQGIGVFPVEIRLRAVAHGSEHKGQVLVGGDLFIAAELGGADAAGILLAVSIVHVLFAHVGTSVKGLV